jgi:hypothetical protein
MTRTEMLELHDKIKENKFRENPVLNTRYAKGYYEQMEQLAKAFWEQVKDAKADPNNPLGKISWNFIHDLYAANLKVRNFANSIEEDDYAFYQQYDALKHVTKEYEQSKLLETFYELDIYLMEIHYYLEIGFMQKYAYWHRKAFVEFSYDVKTKEYIPWRILKFKNEEAENYYTADKIKEVFPTIWEREQEREDKEL